MEQDPLWEERPPTAGEVFGSRLRAVRTQLGWTQKRLSERLRELGHPMNRATLSVPGPRTPPSVITDPPTEVAIA